MGGEQVADTISVLQLLCPTFCDLKDCSLLGSSGLHDLLELLRFMSTELVMPSYHLILCRPLLLLPSLFPSMKVFSNEPSLGRA